MRKLFVLPMVLAVFFADFGAFGATARSSRGNSNATNATSAPVAARAAVRGAKTASTTAAQPTKQNAPVSARAATRNAPKTTATASAGGAVAARAGAKQKVINMGTKVESATANTGVSEECQNAYYGCMDSFCMLDNVSGGRCQCSDRHAELEKVLADIMALDEQSLLMATEGVERLQMGQNADEIMARAKGAADKVVADNTKKQKEEVKNKRKTLDLSSWTSLSFGDVEDDIFDGMGEDEFKDDISGKTGDSLHNAVAKLCKAQVPSQCKASVSMLQLTYVQKIKSDCSAYENSLKQQQAQSAEKLRTAKQALRETALEQFQNENKYDLGGCVLAFRECMQTTGGCGDDFGGCVADTVTLSIDENQGRSTNGGKQASDFTKTKSINTGLTTINIDAATYGILESKKLMCDSVLNQCVKVRDDVWGAFLRDVAPIVKTAQVNAESNRRMECVTVVANCVKKSCGSKWDEESDNYDACINDIDYVNEACKIELQKCGNEKITGSLMLYVQQKLSAMKVDRCTTQVKECLQSENACGKDYLGCLGLSANKILELCPETKLTSCMEKFGKEESTSVREYVVQVAKGLALNMDNAFAKACQNAVDEAMIKVCGDTESCSGLEIDNSALVDEVFKYRITNGKKEYNTVEMITSDEINKGLANGDDKYIPFFWKASLPTVVKMAGTGNDFKFSPDTKSIANKERQAAIDALANNMNQNLQLILSSIENDATVKACREGINPQWFTDTSVKTSGPTVTVGNGIILPQQAFNAFKNLSLSNKNQPNGRFPNITNNIKQTIGFKFYSKVMNQYNEKLAEMEERRAADATILASKYAQTAEEREQACLDMAKQKEADIEALKITASAQYNKQTSKCTVTYTEHKCVDWDSGKGKCDTGYCDHRMRTSTQVCNMLDGKCEDSVANKCSGYDHCEEGWVCN